MAISVKNIKELYAAVNNVANEGKKIILSPGTYTLDPAVNNTNGGRLELQEGMELHGQIANPQLVVIDISGLPPASYAPGVPNRTGAIRLGKGKNKLVGLTVMGKNDMNNSTALSVIDTDLNGKASPDITIANCIIEGGRIGINVRNVLAQHDFRITQVTLKNNVIKNNLVSDAGTQQGQGIVLQHANGVSNATIKATMQGNKIHGNIIGMRIFNNSNSTITDTNNNTILVTSKNDVVDSNKLGIYISCASNSSAQKKINGNFISFEATGTKIQNNLGILPDPTVLPSGIFVTGGNSRANCEVSFNKIMLKLTDCPFVNNKDLDIEAFGAFTQTASPVAQAPVLPGLPGTFNVVKILLGRKSQSATRKTTDCYPPEPTPTNKVIVIP